MFNLFFVQPIFNLLVLIYAFIPNFGAAIIVFTIIVRLLMTPLIRKQLHQTKAIRALQPELKRIKQETKGNRQRESMLVMELYKERNISPFGSIGILIVQFVILIALYQGLLKVINNPEAIIDFSYSWLNNIGFLKEVAADISRFDATLFGVVDLSRAALSPQGFYLPAFLLVVGSAAVQYFQSNQLMPRDKDARKLRQILKEASTGKQAEQAEINAAVGRSTRFFIPIIIFVVTIGLASALSLYWFVSGLVAYIQQGRILKESEEELEDVADETVTVSGQKQVIEGEVVSTDKPPKKPAKKKKKTKSAKKRRR